MTQDIVKTERLGAVLSIRLANPATRNSLTGELRAQLGAAVAQAAEDRRVRAVLLSAEGPTFCSGGDLHMLKDACDPWPVLRRFRGLDQWLLPLLTLPKPVVVAINGAAVGGGMGIALAGDVAIAGESAKLMAGFFRLGVVPDVGIMHLLPRLIGMAQTKNFLFSGSTYNAQQAQQLGLVARVVPDDKLFEEGLAEAQRLAAGPAEVMGLAKSLLARTFETGMHDMFAFEGFGQALAMSNPEFREGLSAALDKRQADFTGAAQRAQEAGK
ncbi:enoyl-CoA hydratase/isomerase family protein [Imbroritus primus]|uniref:enoyl-CoA hydratase/isomerase family protein n=1 Tax=Imbroritus primus TaxID=3058603 RepID=UPI003D161C15